jgi:hypothetical protein
MNVTSATMLTIIALLAGMSTEPRFSGPACLGPYCVDQALSTEDVFRTLGNSSAKGSPYCYTSKDSRTSVIFQWTAPNLWSLTLLDHPQCGAFGALTTTDVSDWKTHEGIGLNSSKDSVLKTYGPPTATPTKQSRNSLGGEELVYTGRLGDFVRSVRFKLKDGKVSEIALSSQDYSGPQCLGAFCLNRSASLRSLTKELESAPGNRSTCYAGTTAKAFLRLEPDPEASSQIDRVVVSDFPTCNGRGAQSAQDDTLNWKTKEGIGLGSTYEDVLEKYGKPSSESKLDSASYKDLMKGLKRKSMDSELVEKTLSYRGQDDLRSADFGIKNGKVSYLWLSDRE